MNSKSSPTPHKWANEIKAWADGHPIQLKMSPDKEWQDITLGCIPFFSAPPPVEWRIKPQHPTLAAIAKNAWYGNSMDTPAVFTPGYYRWKIATIAVKKAIESGNYSPEPPACG